MNTSADTHDGRASEPQRPASGRPRRRWPWVLAAIVVVLVAFFALFDWNMLRGPAERFASDKLGRPVEIGHLDVRWRGLTPRIVLSDVTVGNAEWAGEQPMARAQELAFSLKLSSLFGDQIVLPSVHLAGADVSLVRREDGRANWRFRDREAGRERGFEVRELSVDDTHVALNDQVNDLRLDLNGKTREDGRYATRVEFKGTWRGGEPFRGVADTGSVLTLRASGEPFPVRLQATAGKTSIRAEGEIADVTQLSHIDTRFAIEGPTLANLYPTLGLSLPDTPPYKASGHLQRSGNTFRFTGFDGEIGRSHIAGDAVYVLREPRPLLTAELKSKRLNIADLGPAIGAGAKDQDERVLPRSNFNLDKLNAMDADVQLTAARVQLTGETSFQDLQAQINLSDGKLQIDPLRVGFAGGTIAGSVAMDASQQPMAGKLALDLQRIRVARVMPDVEQVKADSGRLGGQIRLSGRGGSVAALLGSANGSVTAVMTGGRVAELPVWLAALQGDELIPLLFGDDQSTIQIRCGAMALDVKGGIAGVDTFVFDTEQVRINADGSINLRSEQLDLTLYPRPKNPGILSLRGPIKVTGTLGDPDFAPTGKTMLRAAGAAALALVNPLLALLPTIETGPGEDAPCRQLLQSLGGATAQTGQSAAAAPPDPVKRDDPAPIVDARKKDLTEGREQPAPIIDARKKASPQQPAKRGAEARPDREQPPAPIVDVAPKK